MDGRVEYGPVSELTVSGKHYVTEQMNKLLLQVIFYVAGGVKSVIEVGKKCRHMNGKEDTETGTSNEDGNQTTRTHIHNRCRNFGQSHLWYRN